jgi:hypothetical protein
VARTKAQIEKAQERADLQKVSIIWIGIAATEANLQRLGALLLFADRVEIKAPVELGPLPWEDPTDPRYQQIPELEVDYEVVKRSIAKHLSAYVKIHGEERARAVLNSFGAPRLSSVPQEQLIPLNAALEAALQAEPKRATE